MDFLKEILGEELFAQVSEKINAHNGNEANKEKQIKLANLGGGEYVSKAKHDALQALFDGKEKELTAANGLIDGFKKSQKDNEAVQGQITAYQDQVKQLQEQLVQTQIDSGLKIAFMEAGGADIDFLIWKAKQGNDGKPLELGEDGKIKGIDDLISGLKTSAPNHFKKAGGVKVEENPLPNARTGGMTRAEFMRKPYAERAAYANENPEAYKELMKP
jgi:hypothetical protein